MIKVGLLDKNELFRESLNFLIDFKTEMEIHFSSNDFSVLRAELKPGMLDVLLVEISSISENEKIILKEIIHHFPETKFIILSDAISKCLVNEFIPYRISGFYSKSIRIDKLQKGIQEICDLRTSVEVKFGSFVQKTLINNEFFAVNNNDTAFFSDRELQVLQLVCREFTNAEIAEKLELSVRTIEAHRRRMIERTESRSIVGVLMYAFSNSIELPLKGRIEMNTVNY